MVVKVSISVPNDSNMITLSQYEAPIRLMMSGSAQWLCFLLPSSSILPSRSISSSLSADAAAPRAFPKRQGAWTTLTLFAPGLASRNTGCWSSANPRLPCSQLCTPPLCRKFFACLALALASSNRIASRQSQSRQHWKAPGAPDYATAIPSCLLQDACNDHAISPHRRGDACPVEQDVSSD